MELVAVVAGKLKSNRFTERGNMGMRKWRIDDHNIPYTDDITYPYLSQVAYPIIKIKLHDWVWIHFVITTSSLLTYTTSTDFGFVLSYKILVRTWDTR